MMSRVRLALDVHHEPDAARVALGPRVVEPLRPSFHRLRLSSAASLPFRRAALRLRRAGSASRGCSASCARSMWVDSTTSVSVRATPSISRMRLISRSSDDVFAVFTLRSSVYSPVTWWHSSTSLERRDLLLEVADRARVAR